MKKIIKSYWPVIVLSLLCLLIISVWFKDQKFLATGEEGLILANPERSIKLYKYSWSENGIGGASPGSNPTLPLLYLESYLIKIGLSVWVFQGSVFYLLMLIGSVSMYLFVKELFKDIVEKNLLNLVGFIAGIFYIFNPVSLLGVWYRFLLGFMFFYALVPLFLYLYVVGLNCKKNIFIVFIPLLTLLFTFAFSGPALPLLLWLLPFTYSISFFLNQASTVNLRSRTRPFVYFFLMFGLWLIINTWWIYPYVELSKFAFSSETSLVHATGTLKANSQDFGLYNVIRLIHGGFLYRGEAFGSIYKSPPFLLISWLIPLLAIYGLFKIKKGFVRNFFILNFFLLLFLVKGTSPPLGGLFLWLFSHITILQIYRNPLEKIGMLLPTIYAPLFGLGLAYISGKINILWIKRAFFISAVLGLVVLCWPMLTGAVINFDKRDIRVEVPASFREANQAIPTGNHIIFSLPQVGASGRYKWSYGYSGVDVSEYLFSYPIITKTYDGKSLFGQLLAEVSTGELTNLEKIMQFFSADILAFRKDTNLSAFGYKEDVFDRSEKMITEAKLVKLFDSNEVSLWSLPEEKIVPVVYAPSVVKFGDSPKELFNLLEYNQYDPMLMIFICVNKDNCHPNLSTSQISEIRIDNIPETIEVNKISPVEYRIRVVNSKGRFILVFNNSYHPGWSASINDKPLSQENHIVANGYANGFIIDKLGNFDISLQFMPEKSIKNASNISLISVIIGVLIIILSNSLRYLSNNSKQR